MSATMSATTMLSRRFVRSQRPWQNINPKVWRTNLLTGVGARDVCSSKNPGSLWSSWTEGLTTRHHRNSIGNHEKPPHNEMKCILSIKESYSRGVKRPKFSFSLVCTLKTMLVCFSFLLLGICHCEVSHLTILAVLVGRIRERECGKGDHVLVVTLIKRHNKEYIIYFI